MVGNAAPKLSAAVTLDGDTSLCTDDILAAVELLLPRYMVPGKVEILPELPLTSNGKLDRKAVQAILGAEDESGQYLAPRTPLETALAAIIGETISAPRVGVEDDFFSLGGDSVLATQVIARVRDWLDTDAVVGDIFATRSVAGLARRLVEKDDAERLEQVAQLYLEVAAMDDEQVLEATNS